jgi:hypothetical protein
MAAAAASTRRAASVYSLSGLLRCVRCGERMRAVHNQGDQVRYYCRSRARGIACTGKGSFLHVYEAQLVEDLDAFVLPDDWKTHVLAAAESEDRAEDEREWQQPRSRLERLKELYSWNDLTREEYQTEGAAMERELAQLEPVERRDARLSVLADYLDSVPTAWADATPAQRNELASISYESIWVDGPVVEYVKPRPELEPLFQLRTGAAQPLFDATDCHAQFSSGDPDGERDRMYQWDFAVDEPVPTDRFRSSLPKNIDIIRARIAAGESLRTLGHNFGVSYESVRRAIRSAAPAL